MHATGSVWKHDSAFTLEAVYLNGFKNPKLSFLWARGLWVNMLALSEEGIFYLQVFFLYGFSDTTQSPDFSCCVFITETGMLKAMLSRLLKQLNKISLRVRMGSLSETHSLSALGLERRQTGSELPLLPRPPSKVYVFGYGRVGTGGVQEMTAISSTVPLFFELGLSVNLRHAISPRLPCQESPGSFCLSSSCG